VYARIQSLASWSSTRRPSGTDRSHAAGDPLNSLDKQSRVTDFIADPRKAVWTLAVPMMMGMLIQTLYNITDMIFVGRLGGEQVAALTFCMPISFFAIGITFGLGSGATSAVARFIGASDKASADNAAEHAILIGLSVGLVIVAAALAYKESILGLLGAEGDVLVLAIDYFEIISPGFLFTILNVTFRSILSGEGDTRTPLLLQGSGTILNIGLDPLFIFGLDMGIRGAATATVASQGLVFLAFLGYIFVRRGTYVELHLGAFRPSARIASDILKVGLPASAGMVIMSVGSMFYNRIVATFGADAVAGLGVGGRMDSVFFMPIFALAMSQVTLVGMFHGAGRVDLVRQTVVYTASRAALFAVFVGGLYWVFAEQAARIFTDEPAIIDVATQYIRTLCFAFPFISIGIITGRVFQGLGRGMPGLLITLLRVALISVPLAWVLTRVFGFGLQAVWIAFAVSGPIASTVAVIWVHYELRRLETTD
jgi:putative MATE family efflux protein